MSWFDIIKEPLISIPKGSVRIKKPKKIETREDCKERLKAFIEKVKSITVSQQVTEVGNNKLEYVPEEAACKALELLRKEANNKDYFDGGVNYRGKFPEVRERHGNLPRYDDVGDWEISVVFAKFDLADRSKERGMLSIEFFKHDGQTARLAGAFSEGYYKISVYFNTKRPEHDNYDKVKAVVP